MEVDATVPFPVGSVSVGFSLDVILGGDRVAMLDAEYFDLIIAKGTKLNSWKWVKKRESQFGELNKLKLKVVVLHDGSGKEVDSAS